MEISRAETTPAAGPRPSADVRPTAERLEAIARIIAEEEGLWGPHRRHDPAERHYARLVRTEEFEAWLLTWTDE